MFSKQIKDLATEILELCRKNKLKVVTAESLTGGLIIGALTEIPGSSDVVDRGFITYTNLAKQQSLKVKPETLNNFGAVSEQTAKEMVFGALTKSEASVAISITGIAGPDSGEKQSTMDFYSQLTKEEKMQYRRKNLGQIFAQNLNTSIGAERDERDTKSILNDINKIFPGLVHIAAQKLGNAPLHEKHQFGNIGREKVREASIIAALNLLKKVI